MTQGVLLDSNLLIYATQSAYISLIDWIVKQDSNISIISKVEVLGYHQLNLTQNQLLQELFSCLSILYLTPRTYDIVIELRQQKKMGLPDALIAATAIEHRLTLATHNVKDFKNIPITICDPLALLR